MASGFGVSGGPGRCYPIWMDFSKCMAETDDPKACADFRDDYLECLHHRKEFTKLNVYFRESKLQQEGKSSHGHGHGGGGH
eukprot:scaffold17.g514.t1